METQIETNNVELPDDIVEEILIKLPILSVFKCRCVSKRWLSLISDASFTSRYVTHSQAPLIFLFQINRFKETLSFLCTDRTLKKIPNSTFPSPRFNGLKILSTAADLILYHSDYPEPAYYVANPFTTKCVRLPLLHRMENPNLPPPALIPNLRNGGYTVVRAFKEAANTPTLIEIFSSESGESIFLRPRSDPDPDLYLNIDHIKFESSRSAVVLGEDVIWLCDRATAIVAYRGGAMRLIRLPSEEGGQWSGINAVVGACCGELYYFEMCGVTLEVDKKMSRWKLWVMGEYEKGEWRRVREGGNRKMGGAVGNMVSTHSPLQPIAVHPNRKEILVYFWYEGYILTFDTTTGCFHDKVTLFTPGGGIIASSEIYPLLTPLASTRLPHNNTVAV